MITLNGTEILATLFPDQTSQVWKVPETAFQDPSRVEWIFQSEAELIHLGQLKALLDQRGIQKVLLSVPYLPYARQDKPVGNGETFALTTFAQILNGFGFHQVKFVDGHSPKALQLIHHAQDDFPVDAITYAVSSIETPGATKSILVFPDAGAGARYGSHLHAWSYICGSKVRNPSSGCISGVALESPEKVEGQHVLIIDDICDGGSTFVQLAPVILAAGARSVNLYVTHGIFSRGLELLKRAGISRIFTRTGEAH